MSILTGPKEGQQGKGEAGAARCAATSGGRVGPCVTSLFRVDPVPLEEFSSWVGFGINVGNNLTPTLVMIDPDMIGEEIDRWSAAALSPNQASDGDDG